MSSIPMPHTTQPARRSGASADSPAVVPPPVLATEGFSLWYGKHQALFDVTLEVPERTVTAVIGPSGCGKSTLLRCFNRMNDLIPGARVEGEALFQGDNLYGTGVDAVEVRRRIGMVFQKPNPFPKSIRDNLAFPLRINGIRDGVEQRIETALRRAALWDEVKDRLNRGALELSGGQQQRLCIARALATEPDVLLMDEPCSALDPGSTARIEDLIQELSQRYTVVIVTHNMQQAARVSTHTAFFYIGRLEEFDDTRELFAKPKNKRTEDYITGRFG